MRRLKDYLLIMKANETTFSSIYEGAYSVAGQTIYDSTYWHDEIGFKYERTHKLALDKPTVTISIPIKMLNLTQEDCKCVAAGDYILRRLKKYFDELNETIANRKRPDKENGKYYIYEPTGEVLKRNCVYFEKVPRRYYSYEEIDRPAEFCVNIITQIQLPHKKIKKTIDMLTKKLPKAIDRFIADFE